MRLPCGIFSERYAQTMAIVRTKPQWVCTIGAILIAISFPFWVSNYSMHMVNIISIYVLSAIGLNILVGYAGQISLAHAAFMAVGAYTSGIVNAKLGVPFILSIFIGGLVAGGLGISFGFPALRIKGYYLILSTMAAHFIIMFTIEHWTSITGGKYGLPLPQPKLAFVSFDNDRLFYPIILVFLLAGTIFAANLSRSRTGRAFIAIRDNDLAAEIMGISIVRYKLLSFFIGCFYAGIAGALLAHWSGSLTPEWFEFMFGLWFFAYLLIGGLGSNLAPYFGVPLLILVAEGLRHGTTIMSMDYPGLTRLIMSLHDLVYGILIVIFLIWEPRGLAHRWNILKAAYRLRPFSYQ